MDTDPALVSTSIDSKANFNETINDKIYRLRLRFITMNYKTNVMIKVIAKHTHLSQTIRIVRCES